MVWSENRVQNRGQWKAYFNGKPTSQDASYDSEATLIEERVVLIRARSLDEAISKAESEAKKDASEEFHNPYGQIVKQRYLKACDAFELYDDPDSGREVFSTTALVPKSMSDNEIINQHLGVKESKDGIQRRRKFFNAELSLDPIGGT